MARPGGVAGLGPWAAVGMVADLEKHLGARGLELVTPAAGAKLAVDVFLYGATGEPEVLLAGGTEPPARPARRPVAVTAKAS